jgi:RimJ/RimL family protein N-acetyltransferase
MSGIVLPIETERLLIRPLRLDDAEDLHELYSDADAMRFLEDRVPETIGESRNWVQTKIDLFERDAGMSLWAVVERASSRVVGDAGLQWEVGELDLGCRIVPRCQGRGYASEASRAIVAAAFAAGHERLTALTHVEHATARHVLERIGFRFERETEWCGRPMALYALEACVHG